MKKSKQDCVFTILIVVIFCYQLVTAIGISPLYSNCFLDFNNDLSYEPVVIGKEWINGLFPYRDLFGTHGIVIYMLYTIGYFFGKRTGLFILYTIAIIIGFVFWEKNLLFFMEKKSNKVSMALTLFLLYPMIGICGTGLQTDMLIFPVVMILIYLAGKSISGKEQNNVMLWGTIGLLTGMTIWMDSTIGFLALGIYVATVIVLCKNKWHKKRLFIVSVAFFLLIFAAISMYLSLNHALDEAIEGIFEFSLWSLLQGSESWNYIVRKSIKCIPLIGLLITCILGLQRKITSDKKSKYIIILGFTIPAFILLMLGSGQWYRYIWSAIAVPIEIVLLQEILKERKFAHNFGILLFCGISFGIFLVPAKDYIQYYYKNIVEGIYKEEYVVVQDWLETMEEKPENILAVDISPRYYLITDLQPRHRFFTKQTEWYSFKETIGLTVNEFIQKDDALWILVTGRGVIYHQIGNYYWINLWTYDEPVAVYQWFSNEAVE